MTCATTYCSRLAAASALLLMAFAGAARADYQLTILHINDMHARFEPINSYDSTCSAEEAAAKECFGGAARLKTAIGSRRDALKGKNVLTLSAGDQFQGSLFYTHYKGTLDAEIMNAIGFDAMVVGNHEFDDGPEVLGQFAEKVDFPVLLANADFANEPKIAEKIEPYVIKETGGEKVAIIGLLAEDTDELASPGPNVTFLHAEDILPGLIEKIEAEGANKVIVLSHMGIHRDSQIAAAVDGIDAIVGGHTNTLLSNKLEDAEGPYPMLVEGPAGVQVPIVQAYAYTKYLGELTLTFDDSGKVTAAGGDLMLLDASIEEDPDLVARIKEAGRPLEELKNRVIGEAADAIDGERTSCRVVECEMGVLVADAILDRVAEQGVSIVFQNGGGLRASIDAGPITMGEVLTVLPFQNAIATFELTGAGVIKALENGASQLEEGAGRFAQVAGLRYALDPKAEPGSRISKVEVKKSDGSFEPIDPEATYLIGTNNYLRAGGDGYDVFRDEGAKAYDFGPSLEDVVADYLGRNSPYEPHLDNRITIAP